MSFQAAAVDLGATSGRVILGEVAPDRLVTHEVARFSNAGVRILEALHWDVLGLYANVLGGLREAGRLGSLASIGIDTWAVDFGLLGHDGRLLGNPHHYRDERFAAVVEDVHAQVPAAELYRRTGIQHLPFNTVFQLAAARRRGELDDAAQLLLIPDLLSYFLTGERAAEETNASTTALLGVDGRWDAGLCASLDLPESVLAPLAAPGSTSAPLLPAVMAETALAAECQVTTVASHDTASAVVAVPATSERFAYISSGTWSLVGLELAAPVLSEESRAANFTNERGVDGTVRFLRNVAGFYLLEECRRLWALRGLHATVVDLVAHAARLPVRRCLIDVDDPGLDARDVPAAIAAACRRAGEPLPESPAEITRCLFDSIAAAYARTLAEACALADSSVDVVHLVGGGAQSELLAQLTADACDRPVVAGPVEAAAIGNLLVQARTHGVLGPDRADLRRLVAGAVPTRCHLPRPEEARRWRTALARLASARASAAR